MVSFVSSLTTSTVFRDGSPLKRMNYQEGLDKVLASTADGQQAKRLLLSAEGSTFGDTYPSLAQLYNENYYNSQMDGGGVYYANKYLRSSF